MGKKLQSYFGYRFEALCTGHDASKPVDANDKYVGLFNCKLGDHRLAVVAEIDCVDDSGAYVELKTNKLLASRRLVGHLRAVQVLQVLGTVAPRRHSQG